jgi:hypothetical protein
MQWRRWGAVVFAGGWRRYLRVGGPVLRGINFFITSRAARAWARRHPEITGTAAGLLA